MRRPASLDIKGMIGSTAQVMKSENGKLKVFYQGEIWDAVSSEPLVKDEQVTITRVDHMKLVVKRSQPADK